MIYEMLDKDIVKIVQNDKYGIILYLKNQIGKNIDTIKYLGREYKVDTFINSQSNLYRIKEKK